MARIYCGTLKSSTSKIHIFGPTYPQNSKDYFYVTGVKLFHFMGGTEISEIDSIPAGNIFGIAGLDNIIMKTAMICSEKDLCPKLTEKLSEGSQKAHPVVRVAVHPEKFSLFFEIFCDFGFFFLLFLFLGQMEALKRGLKLLNRADTAVQVLLQESGEYVICAIGELHLAVWFLRQFCNP